MISAFCWVRQYCTVKWGFFLVKKNKPKTPSSARLEQQNGHLTQVEVNEMLGLVSHVAAEVPPNNAVPSRVVFLVELLWKRKTDSDYGENIPNVRVTSHARSNCGGECWLDWRWEAIINSMFSIILAVHNRLHMVRYYQLFQSHRWWFTRFLHRFSSKLSSKIFFKIILTFRYLKWSMTC